MSTAGAAAIAITAAGAVPVHATTTTTPQIGVKTTYAVGSPHRSVISGGQGGSLTFHGGQLPFNGGALLAPKLYLDFWGTQWSSDSATQSFISTFGQNLAGSSWGAVMQQYCLITLSSSTCSANPMQNVAYGGAWNDTSTVPNPLNDPKDGTASGPISGSGGAVERAIQHFNGGVLDTNGVYMILTPNGTNPSWWGGGACAYHSAIEYPEIGPPYTMALYAVIPFGVSQTPGCGGNTLSGGNGGNDAFTISISHEFSEAATDPDAMCGWMDATAVNCNFAVKPPIVPTATPGTNGGEIADKCESPTNQSQPGLALGGKSYALALLWSNKDGGCVISSGASTVTIPTAPTGVTATAGTGQVVVSWTPSTGATSYKVYVTPTVAGTPLTVTAPPATITGLTNGTSYSFTVTALNGAGESQQSTAATATPKPPQTFQGGGYTSVVPYRVLDTRPSGPGVTHIGPNTPGPGATINVTVAGTGGSGGVPAGATGVVLNVTAVSPTASGYLTVFPTGVAKPTASNLNFTPGVVVPNLVEVALGTSGAISIYNSAGSTDVIADVAGYTSSTGDGFTALPSPQRLEDTRNDGKTLGSNGTLTVAMPSTVPSTATGVVLNVTETNPSTGGYLTVYPAGATRPTASNLNFTAGETVPNRVQVKLGSGSITIYNLSGTTDVIVDLNGYFAPGGGAMFTGVTPTRLEDTRNDGKTIGTSGTLPLTVASSTSPAGVPANAKAVVLNVTVADETLGGYLTVSPGSSGHQTTSDLNFGAAQVVPNLVVVGVTNGAINFYNFSGSTDVIVDIAGWYT